MTTTETTAPRAWIEISVNGTPRRVYGTTEHVTDLLVTHIVTHGRHLPAAKQRYARSLVAAAVRRAHETSDDGTAAVTCAGVRARIAPAGDSEPQAPAPHPDEFIHADERPAESASTRPTVTVYSKPSCVQCTATYRALNNAGVQYDVVDLTTDEAARDYVLSLGHLQAPVVVAVDQHWSGYRPERITAIAEDRA
jgi:glutaredoxin-like protein NrdH